MTSASTQDRGITLFNLLLTIALVGSTLVIGAPGLQSLLDSTRTRIESNAFLHGIHLARRESVKRNRFVSLCKTRDFARCDQTAEWHDGWMVFVDSSESWPPRRLSSDPIVYKRKPTQNVVIKSNRSAYSVRTLRKRTTNGTAIFCPRARDALSLGVVVSYTGRPRQRPLNELRTSLACSNDDR